MRCDREDGSDEVDEHERADGHEEGQAIDGAQRTAAAQYVIEARPAFGDELDDPGGQDEQGQRAYEGDFVRLEDAGRIDVEEERRKDEGQEPTGFHDPIAVAADAIWHKGVCYRVNAQRTTRARQSIRVFPKSSCASAPAVRPP